MSLKCTKYLCATAHSLTKYCYNQSFKREILYIQANWTPKKSKITYNINKGMVIQWIVLNRTELQNSCLKTPLRSHVVHLSHCIVEKPATQEEKLDLKKIWEK